MSHSGKNRASASADVNSRAAILRAALEVFSREGAAGARTEEIARAAGVNKALLYYYFRDKDALLGAVLNEVLGQALPRILATIEAASTPREQLLAYINLHFDSIAANPHISRLMQYEILRAAEGQLGHLAFIAKRFSRPLSQRIQRIIEDGIRCGDFRRTDARQATLSVMSTIILYFLTAPMLRLVTEADPYAPSRLAARKAAVIDFASHALFAEPGAATQGKKRKTRTSSERKK